MSPAVAAMRASIAALDARRKTLDARIAALSTQEIPRAFPDAHAPRYSYLVHRDTYPGRVGMWRITYLCEGVPAGHMTGATYSAALREAVAYGADLTREIPIA